MSNTFFKHNCSCPKSAAIKKKKKRKVAMKAYIDSLLFAFVFISQSLLNNYRSPLGLIVRTIPIVATVTNQVSKIVSIGILNLCVLFFIVLSGLLYTHTDTYIHTYIHTYTHTYIHTHTHTHTNEKKKKRTERKNELKLNKLKLK